MQKLVLGFICLVLTAIPGQAIAGGYSVSQDGAVKIYRGDVPTVSQAAIHNDFQAEKAKAKTKRLQAKMRAQKRALREQQVELDRLEHKIEHLEDKLDRPRPRYGRSYYGNPRFFGVNGFVGNRFHSGGTIVRPRSRY